MTIKTNDQAIYSIFREDPDFCELIDMFVAEMPQRVAAFEQASAKQDWDELQRLSHQLKGAAGGYGFDQLTLLASSVEEAVELRSSQEVTKRLAELLDACRRVASTCS